MASSAAAFSASARSLFDAALHRNNELSTSGMPMAMMTAAAGSRRAGSLASYNSSFAGGTASASFASSAAVVQAAAAAGSPLQQQQQEEDHGSPKDWHDANARLAGGGCTTFSDLFVTRKSHVVQRCVRLQLFADPLKRFRVETNFENVVEKMDDIIAGVLRGHLRPFIDRMKTEGLSIPF